MYSEFSPCKALTPYIDKYWEFKGDLKIGKRIHILPDGCADFIFTLDKGMQATGGPTGMQPYRSYFVGPMTKYLPLKIRSANVHQMGIRFRPGGVFRFLQLPMDQLTDLRVDTANLGCFFNDSWSDRLDEKKETRERIHLLEELLLKRFFIYRGAEEQKIRFVIDRIDASRGRLPIGDLAGAVHLCPRQLERKFKGITGFTPKEYSRIIRFRHTVDLLRNLPFDNLLSTAVEAGFYDASHLCRETKKMSGGSPLAFLSAPQPKEITLTYIEG